ncbi:hypothetical protein T12_8828 [Trichinella patagoniensis]|uniref:Uncharacterized protein n=1 Tax=Trichinella patagoniensis TaxID=990121 RepID=A0A0V0ZQ26_9BILA|nr:hypothetical protein T12_8828 [Trichinella patagoniensis]
MVHLLASSLFLPSKVCLKCFYVTCVKLVIGSDCFTTIDHRTCNNVPVSFAFGRRHSGQKRRQSDHGKLTAISTYTTDKKSEQLLHNADNHTSPTKPTLFYCTNSENQITKMAIKLAGGDACWDSVVHDFLYKTEQVSLR